MTGIGEVVLSSGRTPADNNWAYRTTLRTRRIPLKSGPVGGGLGRHSAVT